MLVPQDPLHLSASETLNASPLSPSLSPRSPQFIPEAIIDPPFPSSPRSPHNSNHAYVPPPSSPQQWSEIEMATASPQELPPAYTPAKQRIPGSSQSSNAAAAGRNSSPRIVVSEHFLDETANRRHSQRQRQQHLQPQKRHTQPYLVPVQSSDKNAATTVIIQSKEIQYDYNHEYFRGWRCPCCVKCCIFLILLAGAITGILFATVFKHSASPFDKDPPNKDELCKTFGCLNQNIACNNSCKTDAAYLTCLKPCDGDWACSIKCQRANSCWNACDDQIHACQRMCM